MNFAPTGKHVRRAMRLPLVALIDVTLFLLLYFMMAGSFTGEESQLAATLGAEAKGGGQGSNLQQQVLSVETSGGLVRYKIGDRVVSDRASLLSVLKQLPKSAGVIVKVAGDAPISGAAAALQACKDAGFVKVSYVPSR